MSKPLDNPGVHFPPPLVYAIAFIAGWLLGRIWPLPVADAAAPWRVVVATLCAIVWLTLMFSAFATFARSRTTIIPNRAASTIVTRGPYRITRNPMYVSMVALYLALALFVNSWWPLFLLPVVVAIIDRLVIAREERYLDSAFPGEYAEYRKRVRRWL